MEHATEILRQAEASLRDVVSHAAAAGDYAGVVQIASWASAVRDLFVGERVDEGKRRRSPRADKGIASHAATPPRKGQRRQSRGDYPRFFRQRDQLVRVAWSKRDKKEYQHKAPYSTIQSLVAAMCKAGRDGRVFSTDQILPMQDAEGSDVPSYQVYVGIALMKHAGLIDQHGRQGYSIPQLTEFSDAVESVWRSLPTF